MLHRVATKQYDGEEMPRAWDSISWTVVCIATAVQWHTPGLHSSQYVTTVCGKIILFHTFLLNSILLYSVAVQCALEPVGRNPSFVGPTLVATWHLPIIIIIIIIFFRVLPESSSLSPPVHCSVIRCSKWWTYNIFKMFIICFEQNGFHLIFKMSGSKQLGKDGVPYKEQLR